jgi:hypothetical protein
MSSPKVKITNRAGALIVTAAITIAGVASAFAPRVADADWDPPDLAPLPGMGDLRDWSEPGPSVRVYNREARLAGNGTIHVEVECWTSTDAGCSGTLALTDRSGRAVASTPFELGDGEGESVFASLPRNARRKAERDGGWPLRATAIVSDSLGRAGSDRAVVRVRGRR